MTRIAEVLLVKCGAKKAKSLISKPEAMSDIMNYLHLRPKTRVARLLALLVAFLCAFPCNTEAGGGLKEIIDFKDGEAAMKHLTELQVLADRVLVCDKDKKFEIGIVAVGGGYPHLRKFEFFEIESFLQDEKHKDLILIQLDLSVMEMEKRESRKLMDQVVVQVEKVGYKRIIVFGSGGSRPYYYYDSKLVSPKLKRGAKKKS